MAKVKVPKKVVGVKIPKKVRKRAKKALKMAESPLVREAAVAALGGAGVSKAIREAGKNGRGRIDADVLVDAIRDAALDGVRRFIEGFEEGLRKAAAAGEAAESLEERDGGEGRGDGGRKPRSRPASGGAAP